jgi:sialate O-acetylesterase
MKNPISRTGVWLIPFCFGLAGGSARADVKLSAMFSDNMVLQRDKSVPVWGTADPGEAVTVKLGDKAAVKTVADAGGRWKVALPPQPAARAHAQRDGEERPGAQ